MRIKQFLTSSSRDLRNRYLFAIDIVAAILASFLAFTFVLGWPDWLGALSISIACFFVVWISILTIILVKAGIYSRYWQIAQLDDYIRLLLSVLVSSGIVTLIYFSAKRLTDFNWLQLPMSFIVLSGFLTAAVLIGMRLILQFAAQKRGANPSSEIKPTLIVGAGEAGVLTAKEIATNLALGLQVIAFVDDDPRKIGKRIVDVPVFGPTERIPVLIKQLEIGQIFVAIPSAPLKRQNAITDLCAETGVATSNLPGLYQLIAGQKSFSRYASVDVNALLDREPVSIEYTEVIQSIRGKVVLVTGAGGSIGSELCRQIARFQPKKIILLGHGENSIFEIGLELQIAHPEIRFEQVITDVKNRSGLDIAMKAQKPSVVFHAAAHKHVGFMESNVSEAILNNVLGSWNVVDVAAQNGVERFVLISSDKAINPTSVMGVTKRVAELLVQYTAQKYKRSYMAVRFGNVLNSRGSVIPKFQQQMVAGGPITVTHPDMKRYFMTIPEAVQLVLQASVLGTGGEIFVLDMDEPMRIEKLAQNMVKQAGLSVGRDIDIVYTGIQPGEKLYEELFLENEEYYRTKHHKIFMATGTPPLTQQVLTDAAQRLIQLANSRKDKEVISQLQRMVPEYKANPSHFHRENKGLEAISSEQSAGHFALALN